jgi:hypothetical protein
MLAHGSCRGNVPRVTVLPGPCIRSGNGTCPTATGPACAKSPAIPRASGAPGGSRLGTVTAATQYRKPRIFREARIGFGELAEQELRAFRGFNRARVLAIGAETESHRRYASEFAGGHGNKPALPVKRMRLRARDIHQLGFAGSAGAGAFGFANRASSMRILTSIFVAVIFRGCVGLALLDSTTNGYLRPFTSR